MATYKSPVDGTLLLPVKNADGDTVYREKGTGQEYTEEYLKENGYERSGDTKAPKAVKAKRSNRGRAKKEEVETPPADEGNEEETPPADEPEA